MLTKVARLSLVKPLSWPDSNSPQLELRPVPSAVQMVLSTVDLCRTTVPLFTSPPDSANSALSRPGGGDPAINLGY